MPEVDSEIRYFRLPYIGERSQAAKQKVKNSIKKYCKDNLRVNLVFTTCKIKDYFSTKDILPACFKSNVIYSFRCARCNSCYVGHTRKHFDVRRKEHLERDKNSSTFKHLNNNKECKIASNNDSFKILDSARSAYELAIKEGMHIKWENPAVNVQKNTNLLIC